MKNKTLADGVIINDLIKQNNINSTCGSNTLTREKCFSEG